MFQIFRFVREIPVFVVGLQCCYANTKSPAEIKLYRVYYNNNIFIIFVL